MASIVAIADGLEARCATIAGLTAYSEWAANPVVPAIMALPPDPGSTNRFLFPTTFDSRYTVVFGLLLMVSHSAGLDAGMRALYPYLDTTGSTSVIAALEADRTLGGIAEDIDLGGAYWTPPGLREFGSVSYMTALLANIEIYIVG